MITITAYHIGHISVNPFGKEISRTLKAGLALIPTFQPFTLGIFLAHITLKHGSIIPSIIVHIFVNSVSSIIGELAEIDLVVSVICYLVLLAAALLGMILLLVFLGRDKLPSTTPKQARRGVLVAASSIPFTCAVVLYVLNIVYTLFAKN